MFRFNSGKNMTNHTIPMKNSIIGGRNDYFWLSVNLTRSGLFLWIHNKSSPPNIERFNNHDDPVKVNIGFSYLLAIDRTKEKKKPKPYSQCYEDPIEFEKNKTIINYILYNKNESYSQVKCLELCFDLYYIQNNTCNCPEAKLGSVWLDCWINREKEKDSCTYTTKNNFYQTKIVDYCSQFCPLECNHDSFSFTLSSDDYIRHNASTEVLIYYRSLKYTSIKQKEKVTIFDLISNLGGSLGLFIGLSFVSLFEIIEILMEVVFIVFRRNNKLCIQIQNDSSKNIETKIKKNDQRLKHLESRMRENDKQLEVFSTQLLQEIKTRKVNKRKKYKNNEIIL